MKQNTATRPMRVHPLAKVVGCAALVRLVPAFFLYFVSYYRWPILRAYQSTDRGFWNFAWDAIANHHEALAILDYWKGIEGPPAFSNGAIEYYLMLAGLYKWYGPNPLYGILLNVLVSSVQVLLAYRIVYALCQQQKTALWAGWLVALWPSNILWSMQVVKDPLCGLLTLTVLGAGITLWQGTPVRHGGLRFLNTLVWLVLLFLATAIVTKLRSYLGIILTLSMGLTFGILCLRFLKKSPSKSLKAAGIALTCLWAMMLAYQTPYPQKWFKIQRLETLPIPRIQPPQQSKPRWVSRENAYPINSLLHQNEQKPIHVWKIAVAASPSKILIEKPLSPTENKTQALKTWKVAIATSPEKILIEKSPNPAQALEAETTEVRKVAMATSPAKILIEKSPSPAQDTHAASAQAQKIQNAEPAEVWIVNPKGIEIRDPAFWTEFRITNGKTVRRSIQEPFSWAEIGLRIWPLSQFKRIYETGHDREETYRMSFDRPARVIIHSADIISQRSSNELPGGKLPAHNYERSGPVTIVSPETLLLDYSGIVSDLRIHYTKLYDTFTYGWGIQPLEVWPLRPLHPLLDLVGPNVQFMQRSLGSQISLQSLMYARKGILGQGGGSVVFPQITFRRPRDLVEFAPRALLVAWFAPFPYQWLDSAATTGGVFRILSGFETLVFYLLLPWILRGAWRLVRRGTSIGWLIIGFIFLFSFMLGLVVPNIGTLFRLRLPMTLTCLLLFPLGALPQNDAKT